MLSASRTIKSAGILAAIVFAGPTLAADIKVISTGNIRPSLDDVQKAFERTGSDKVAFTTQGAAATQRLLDNGGVGDVVVGPRPMLDDLLAKGKIKPGTVTDIAHSSVGVVVRTGEPTPDISTDEKFIAVLLAADSIVYPDPAKGSLGGNLLAKLIRQWGIETQLKAKSLLVDGGNPTGHAVADGRAHFGINQIAEIQSVPGLTFLSPLPPALTDKIVMSAGILSTATEEQGAKAWIAFLSGPQAAPAIKAHGMDPAAR